MAEDKVTLREVLTLIRDELEDVKADIKELSFNLKNGFVSKDAFNALERRVAKIEKGAYSVIGFVIFAVLSALLALVII